MGKSFGRTDLLEALPLPLSSPVTCKRCFTCLSPTGIQELEVDSEMFLTENRPEKPVIHPVPESNFFQVCFLPRGSIAG